MSYLDLPRIHLAGQFFTDPSTVNNDPVHYDPDCTNPSPWQNPMGEHRFELRECFVTSAYGANGNDTSDGIVGSSVLSPDNPISARIVDLDVYQQGVTAIIGMQLKIALPDGTSITGSLETPILNGFWFQAVLPTRSWQDGDYVQDSFGGDMNACGMFQTVVRFNMSDWQDSGSAILQKLKATTLIENNQILVSLKFTLDGYQNVPQDKNYLLGRIVGTLGPYFKNEPRYSLGQRIMLPRTWTKADAWYKPAFNDCPFKVDTKRKKLILDLSNSICRQNAGGDPVDLGTLTATVTVPGLTELVIGSVDYSAFSYSNNAHITELDLNVNTLKALETGPLKLTTSRNDIGESRVLIEPSVGVECTVEVRPIRMAGDPGTSATTKVYVSNNGKPVVGKQLAVLIESVHGTTPGATVAPTNPGNKPQADGAISVVISPSDANGFATVTMTVIKDPGSRTPELDGSLYFIAVFDPLQPHADWTKVPIPQNQMISCLVFSQFTVNENPTWEDIQGIFEPYMKIYPGMKSRIDLTDKHTFTIFSNNPPWARAYNDNRTGPLGITKGAIPYYMSVAFEDPRFMPITRDLSPAKTLTVMHFVKNLQDQPQTPTV